MGLKDPFYKNDKGEIPMKKIRVIALLMVFALLFGTACSSSNQSPAVSEDQGSGNNEQKTVEIKYATVGPDEHQYTIAAAKFKEIIEAKTDGRIKVTLFPNAQLGGEREMAEGVKMGTIQMTTVTSDGALPAWVPETQIFSIPYLFRDREHVYKALDGALAEALNPKFEKKGFKHLGFVELGFRHFTNNKTEIQSVADMKDLKIRVQEAPIWFALIEALKGTATPIPFNELYTALQQGVVDGQENPLATIRSMKFYEVQKYLTLDAHTYAPGSVLMNKDFFDSLSAEDQKLIQEAVDEMKVYQRNLIASQDEDNITFLKEQGMIITEPDRQSFVDATKGLPNLEKVKEIVNPELVELVKGVQ